MTPSKRLCGRRLWQYPSYSATAAVALGFLAASGATAFGATEPSSIEKEVLRISKQLRPIADEQWKQIAGERVSEKYTIVRGDSLYDISKRLFGDAKYWPKIWALNNDSITNPHSIKPGDLIAFLPGTGTSLPTVGIETGETATDAPSVAAGTIKTQSEPMEEGRIDTNEAGEEVLIPRRPQEWKKLPPQRWEYTAIDIKETPAVSMSGETFDWSKRMNELRFDLSAFASSELIVPLGKITGTEANRLFPGGGETVVIRPVRGSELQVGETYAVTHEPYPFYNNKRTIHGYSYHLAGKIKITAQRGDVFVADVMFNRDWIARGDSVIPLPARIPTITPVPGPRQLRARLLIDKYESTSYAAQHKLVFIDRGLNDGITPGMVFRAYQTKDLVTEIKLSNQPISVLAELMVVQSSGSLSTAIVTRSREIIAEGTELTLITDVGALGEIPTITPLQSEDELERLDSEERLRREEEREIKQLERWRGNPPATPAVTPRAEPSIAPTTDVTPMEPTPPAGETPTEFAPTAPEPTPTPEPTGMQPPVSREPPLLETFPAEEPQGASESFR